MKFKVTKADNGWIVRVIEKKMSIKVLIRESYEETGLLVFTNLQDLFEWIKKMDEGDT